MRRLLIIASSFLLVAATAPPLFTPPAGMKQTDLPEAMVSFEAAHHVETLAHYEPANPGKISRSAIIIERYPAHGESAEQRGIETIDAMLHPMQHAPTPEPAATPTPCPSAAKCTEVYHVDNTGGDFIASKTVTVCGNRTGYFDKAVMHPVNLVLAELFVRSGDMMYVVTGNYDPKDPAGPAIDASLLTLCPPQTDATPEPAPSAATPVNVVKAPAGWASATIPSPASGQAILSRWITLGPKSNGASNVFVMRLTGLPDSFKAKDISDMIGMTYLLPGLSIERNAVTTLCNGLQGWSRTQSGANTNGTRYTFEWNVGYGNGAWYIAEYARYADDPEDPQARATLDSLCPPQ